MIKEPHDSSLQISDSKGKKEIKQPTILPTRFSFKKSPKLWTYLNILDTVNSHSVRVWSLSSTMLRSYPEFDHYSLIICGACNR